MKCTSCKQGPLTPAHLGHLFTLKHIVAGDVKDMIIGGLLVAIFWVYRLPLYHYEDDQYS
jgi:hypothetical protein